MKYALDLVKAVAETLQCHFKHLCQPVSNLQSNETERVGYKVWKAGENSYVAIIQLAIKLLCELGVSSLALR